jgi:hypothetical protein
MSGENLTTNSTAYAQAVAHILAQDDVVEFSGTGTWAVTHDEVASPTLLAPWWPISTSQESDPAFDGSPRAPRQLPRAKVRLSSLVLGLALAWLRRHQGFVHGKGSIREENQRDDQTTAWGSHRWHGALLSSMWSHTHKNP